MAAFAPNFDCFFSRNFEITSVYFLELSDNLHTCMVKIFRIDLLTAKRYIFKNTRGIVGTILMLVVVWGGLEPDWGPFPTLAIDLGYTCSSFCPKQLLFSSHIPTFGVTAGQNWMMASMMMMMVGPAILRACQPKFQLFMLQSAAAGSWIHNSRPSSAGQNCFWRRKKNRTVWSS